MRYPGPALLIAALCVHPAASRYDEKLCNDGSYTSPGTDLEYVPNAWNPDEKGFSCIVVRDSPPSFDATWKWSSDPGSVHSYPHVKFSDSALPVTLSNISALALAAQWAMGPGSTPRSVPSIDLSGMKKLDVSANVAFDIFADRNRAKSDNEREAETEIMIWLGRIGHAQPLGYNGGKSSRRAKMTVGHVEFALYQGENQRGTSVFTWAAEENEMSFADDISPLLQYLWRNGLVSPGSHVGLIGFGTEGYHANGNVTFSASRVDVNVLAGPAPTLDIPDITENPEDPTASSSGSSPTGTRPAGDSPEGDSASAAGRLRGGWLSSLSIGGIVGALVVLL